MAVEQEPACTFLDRTWNSAAERLMVMRKYAKETRALRKAFLRDYRNLCERHGMHVHSSITLAKLPPNVDCRVINQITSLMDVKDKEKHWDKLAETCDPWK